MTTDEIRARICALVATLFDTEPEGEKPEEIILLGEGSHIDLITAFRLVLMIEKEFGIVIEDNDLKPDNLMSLPSLTRYVQRKLAL